MSETISIFILKSQTNSLTQAETFLRNRKWIVGSSTNLRDALAYIIQKQPKYVMITADHPNKKVRVLPKMLAQAFPVRTIGFAEKGTGTSAKSLQEMGLEYNLYPPVSGPAIERMVLKIRKDEELRAQQEEIAAKNPRPDGSLPGNDMITFKGDSMSASDMKTSFEQARAALTQMINSDSDDSPAIVAGSAKENGPGSTFTPGSTRAGDNSTFTPGNGKPTDGNGSWGPGFGNSNSGPGWGPGSSTAGGDSFSSSQGHNSSDFSGNVATSFDPKLTGNVASTNSSSLAGKTASTHSPQLKGNVATNHDPQRSGNVAPGTHAPGSHGTGPLGRSSQGSGSGGEAGFFNPETGEGGNFQDGASDWQSGKGPGSPGAASADSDESESGSGRTRKKGTPIMESEYVPKTGAKGYRITRSEERQGKANDSIIVRGTQQALDESVDLKNEDHAQKIEQSSNIACITVQSPKFSGYLVCAMGKNRKIDKVFFDTIQKRLFSFLRSNGEQVKEEDSMNLKIQEVDFTDWALEQAEFLRRSVHDGDEIAMAFFPTTDIEVQLQDSASEKMVKMAINDLKEDIALEFDLYIFMPENNKYLLYTPKGKPFYGKQKGRLHEKGITHMHLRRDTAHNVKKYKAQNFLNEKIAAYKSQMRKPA